mmetsp:Transcript_19648/g.35753  ORF Transcript_19648/g.35753 Transcript_19648/m.35753 type:complete len:139 (-) Transcript_19648:297-713(-)
MVKMCSSIKALVMLSFLASTDAVRNTTEEQSMLSVSVGASAMLKLQGNVSDSNIQWVCGRCMVKQGREFKCTPFYKDGNKSVMWMSNMCFEKKGKKYKKDTDGNCGVVVPAFKDYDGDIWKQKTCEDLNFRVGLRSLL